MPKLVGSVTQGSNDAYAEDSIVTGLTNLANVAWSIQLIQFEVTGAIPGVNLANIEMCLSRGSKAAMPLISDRDVIFKARNVVTFTTSGATFQPMIFSFSPSSELLIVEDTIYLQIDSASTSITSTFHASIEVAQKKVTEQQRLSILASRIGS